MKRHVVTLGKTFIIRLALDISMLIVYVISGQGMLSLASKSIDVISGKVNYMLTLISYPVRSFLPIQSLLRCCFLPGKGVFSNIPWHLSPNVSTSGRIFGSAEVEHTTMGTLSGL